MLHRIHVLVLACVALLASFLVPIGPIGPIGWTDAGASEDCGFAVRPDAAFEVIEPSGLKYEIEFDLGQNSVATVESTRALAGFRLASEGFSPRSTAAVMTYLDALVAWYEFLAVECAPALAYEGPYTNRPPDVGAPYGFGGVQVSVGPPVVMTVTRPEGDASVEVGRVVVADDGPDLAHSGSESFVLAYFGAGLLAFGAAALGMRRWMSGPLEEVPGE